MLQETPFVQFVKSSRKWQGKPGVFEYSTGLELEGMCIDILEELSSRLGFQYNISLVPDNKFGSLKPHGWTGMVREIVDQVMCINNSDRT